jgi:hypothetical protein
MRLAPGDSGAEADLGPDISERTRTVELLGRTGLLSASGEEEDGNDGKDGKAHEAYGLWVDRNIGL